MKFDRPIYPDRLLPLESFRKMIGFSREDLVLAFHNSQDVLPDVVETSGRILCDMSTLSSAKAQRLLDNLQKNRTARLGNIPKRKKYVWLPSFAAQFGYDVDDLLCLSHVDNLPPLHQICGRAYFLLEDVAFWCRNRSQKQCSTAGDKTCR